MGFCEIVDLENKLQLTIPYDSAPALAAIAEATALIQQFCNQTLEAVAADEVTFDVGERQTKLFLPELPVTSIVEVEENGEVLTVTDDYKLGAYGILHRLGAYWYAGVQTVRVVYDHGFATLPQIIRDVCATAAARRYQSGLHAAAVGGVAGVRAMSLGDYSVQYETGTAGTEAAGGAVVVLELTPGEKQALAHYRHRGA